MYYFEISNGVNPPFDVGDGRVVETSHQVEDSVDGSNMGEKGISKALAVGCSFYEASNVDDCEEGRDLGLMISGPENLLRNLPTYL